VEGGATSDREAGAADAYYKDPVERTMALSNALNTERIAVGTDVDARSFLRA
jgi:hypothetical protein